MSSETLTDTPFSDGYDLLVNAGLDLPAVERLMSLLPVDGLFALGQLANRLTVAEVTEQLAGLPAEVFAARHGLADHLEFVEAFRDEVRAVTR